MNWQLNNAQDELVKRRIGGHKQTRTIGEIAGGVMPGDFVEYDFIPDEPSDGRVFEVIDFDDFDFDHLEQEQIDQLNNGIITARDWIGACHDSPGLSFVITGGVGTGKTTIAENLRGVYDRLDVVGGDEPDQRYLDQLAGLVEEGQLTADEAADLGSALVQEVIRVPYGIMVEAGELMPLLKDAQAMRKHFDRYRVIGIDDVGTEIIDFTNPQTFIVNRQKLYGRLFDYAYRNNKHLLITSMIPLLKGEGDQVRFNERFVNIFGAKAFSRLQVKSKGYMVELSGLPDYREVQALRAIAGGPHG